MNLTLIFMEWCKFLVIVASTKWIKNRHSQPTHCKNGKRILGRSDEIVVIPEEGEINIAWFLYEFIALSIPIKHVHEPGKCNRTMTKKLRKHTVIPIEEGEEGESDEEKEPLAEDDIDFEENQQETTDPRWDILKGLKLDE